MLSAVTSLDSQWAFLLLSSRVWRSCFWNLATRSCLSSTTRSVLQVPHDWLPNTLSHVAFLLIVKQTLSVSLQLEMATVGLPHFWCGSHSIFTCLCDDGFARRRVVVNIPTDKTPVLIMCWYNGKYLFLSLFLEWEGCAYKTVIQLHFIVQLSCLFLPVSFDSRHKCFLIVECR